MTITAVYAYKGGAGATTFAAALALEAPPAARPVLLADLGGDAAHALGLTGAGLADTADTGFAPAQIGPLVVPTPEAGVAFLPAGKGQLPDHEPPAQLLEWLSAANAVVDIGVALGDPTGDTAGKFRRGVLAAADCRVLVALTCYSAVKRSVQAKPRPDAIVLVEDQGRTICAGDYERATGAPVLATIPFTPTISAAVDADKLPHGRPDELAAARQLWEHIGPDGERDALAARRGGHTASGNLDGPRQ